MLTFTERTMKQKKGELTNCPSNNKAVFGTRKSWKLASLYATNVLFVYTLNNLLWKKFF